MITEFIKDHKKQCLIVLIAIIVILIIVNIRGKNETNTSSEGEVLETSEEISNQIDVASQLEEDETAQTNYSGYTYAEE